MGWGVGCPFSLGFGGYEAHYFKPIFDPPTLNVKGRLIKKVCTTNSYDCEN